MGSHSKHNTWLCLMLYLLVDLIPYGALYRIALVTVLYPNIERLNVTIKLIRQ